MFDELKPFLNDEIEKVTQKSKGNRKNYICPFCGSGSGENGTGGFSITDDGLAFKCFSCDCSGDIVDFVAEYHKIEPKEAVKRLRSEYLNGSYEPRPLKIKEEKPKEPEDLTSFILQARAALKSNPEAMDYLHKRGLSNEIIERFSLGFFMDYNTPRILIPRSRKSCLCRAIRDCKPYPEKRIKGESDLFNIGALHSEKPFCFVVEGEFDALSFEECGLPAIGLGSTGNYKNLINYLSENPTNKKILIALDNDRVGQKTASEFKTQLEALNLACSVFEYPKEYKDPNALFVSNREQFKAIFSDVDELKKLRATAAGNRVTDFLKVIDKENLTIPTGLTQLDNVLNGGLSDQLYTIGAMPSIGKSALMNFIADHISKNGYPVIYFSLEMTEKEQIARSLSRLSFLKGTDKLAKTQDQILKGFDNYTEAEYKNISACLDEYKTVAQNLYIIDPETPYLEELVNTCKEYKRILGKAPVVIVDYLQLLDVDPKLRINDAKSKTDHVVKTLKSLSQKEGMPIILISSLNREGYSGAVAMQDFKESGIIEFSSNVILGFYFTGLKKVSKAEYEEKLEACKQAYPRQMTINVLKNRSGKSGVDINLNYFSAFNHFREIDISREAFNNR